MTNLVAFTSGLLENVPQLDPAIRQQWLAVLQATGKGYEQLSPARQARVQGLIRDQTDSIPSGVYSTPLQHGAWIAIFRQHLYVICVSPTFLMHDETKLQAQLAQIAHALADSAVTKDPDVKTYGLYDAVWGSCLRHLCETAADDTTPTFKSPLPAAEFETAMREFDAAAARTPAHEFLPGWRGMSEQKRQEALTKSHGLAVDGIVFSHDSAIHGLHRRYQAFAIQTYFKTEVETAIQLAKDHEELDANDEQLFRKADEERTRIENALRNARNAH